jgi:hypothetical protein
MSKAPSIAMELPGVVASSVEALASKIVRHLRLRWKVASISSLDIGAVAAEFEEFIETRKQGNGTEARRFSQAKSE